MQTCTTCNGPMGAEARWSHCCRACTDAAYAEMDKAIPAHLDMPLAVYIARLERYLDHLEADRAILGAACPAGTAAEIARIEAELVDLKRVNAPKAGRPLIEVLDGDIADSGPDH